MSFFVLDRRDDLLVLLVTIADYRSIVCNRLINTNDNFFDFLLDKQSAIAMRARIKGSEETFFWSEPNFSIPDLLRFVHVLVQLLDGLQSFLSQAFAATLNDKSSQES